MHTTHTDHDLTPMSDPHGGPMPSEPMQPTTPTTAPTTGAPMTEVHADHDVVPSTLHDRGPMLIHPPPDDEPIPDTVRMITYDDAVRAELNGVAHDLGVDELRVLVRIGERLKLGRRQYGRLYLPTDTRSFRATEARQELEDALVYLACQWLRDQLHEVTR